MIIYLDENSVLQLTAKAMMINAFRKIYDSSADKDLVMSHFAVLHYMYYFESKFLREYEDEEKRLREVKKFVNRGNEVKVSREMRRALDLTKKIYSEDLCDMYVIMRNNVDKLKDYAQKMSLSPLDNDGQELEIGKFVLVDSKEFMSVNNMLPKQQEELSKFEVRLQEAAKNNIDIYGGGELGAYE